MRDFRTFTLLLTACWTAELTAQRVELAAGSVDLPSGFSHRPLRGTDSHPGTFVRADGTFTIHYDIGGLAGTYMTPSRRNECFWFVEHRVSGYRAYTGVAMVEGNRQIATTVIGDGAFGRALPANFIADVSGDRDVAEFLMIVSSYVPSRGDVRFGSGAPPIAAAPSLQR